MCVKHSFGSQVCKFEIYHQPSRNEAIGCILYFFCWSHSSFVLAYVGWFKLILIVFKIMSWFFLWNPPYRESTESTLSSFCLAPMPLGAANPIVGCELNLHNDNSWIRIRCYSFFNTFQSAYVVSCNNLWGRPGQHRRRPCDERSDCRQISVRLQNLVFVLWVIIVKVFSFHVLTIFDMHSGTHLREFCSQIVPLLRANDQGNSIVEIQCHRRGTGDCVNNPFLEDAVVPE